MEKVERRQVPRRRAVRILFALVVVGFVLQVGVKHVWREPYPGLFQPAFSGRAAEGGVEIVEEPTVTTRYSDGSTGVASHREVLEQSEALPASIFQSAFGMDSPRREDPQTIAWLEQRLSDLGGGRTPESAVIDWRDVTYDLADDRPPHSRSIGRIVISFGGRDG